MSLFTTYLQMDKWDPIYYLILISIYISITIVYFYNTNNGNKNIQNQGSNFNSNPLDPEDPKKNKSDKSDNSNNIKNHLSKYKLEYIVGGILFATIIIAGYCYCSDISSDDIINFFTRKKPYSYPDSPETIVYSAGNTGEIINNNTNVITADNNSTNVATENSDRWMDLPGYKELNLLDRINESDLANSINPDDSNRAQYDFDVDDYLSNYEKSLQAEMEDQLQKESNLDFENSTNETERQGYNFFLDDFDVNTPMEEVENYMLEYEQQLAAEIEDKFQKEYFMNFDKRMAEEMEKQLQQEISDKLTKLSEESYYNNDYLTPSQPVNQELLDDLDETINYFSDLADEEFFSKFMEEGEFK